MKQILVVDDDTMTRQALTKLIKKWEYDVVTAENGSEALEILTRKNPPRMAILDWMMPGMEGIEVCRKLSGRSGSPLVYTILLTIKKDKEDIITALDNGACDFLSKPVHAGELKSRISVGFRLVEAEDKLRRYAQKMKHLAVTDHLTGAFSRRFFMEQFEKEIDRVYRYNQSMSFIMMDIDRFKNLNDRFGHLGGDEVLKQLVTVCKNKLRKSDLFARVGGEEFSMVLPETDEESAYKVAEGLRLSISDLKIPYRDIEISFTVSLGVTSIQSKNDTIDSVIMRADSALYKAKNNGRNRTMLWKDYT